MPHQIYPGQSKFHLERQETKLEKQKDDVQEAKLIKQRADAQLRMIKLRQHQESRSRST